MEKVTDIVRRYIFNHPSLRDCLIKNLINYSSLARKICEEENLEQFDAVLAACRRYAARFKNSSLNEIAISSLISKSKIRVRNKIIVAVIEKPRDFEKIHALRKLARKNRGDFNSIEGEDVVTLITNEEFLPDIKVAFKGRIKIVTEDLVQISMIFGRKIETTPGVTAFVYSLLAEKGINVREEMSCWTDILIVIDQKDMARALSVLDFSD